DEANGFPQSSGLWRLDRRTADLLDQQAAGEERLITQHLGVEPEAWTARQQAVSRVLGQAGLGHLCGLTGGRTPHPALHCLLDVPAVVHELHGQPVEQLRMAWRFALGAEILSRLDQTGAEQLLPEAIGGHASGQRMLTRHQPAGEAEAVAWSIGGQRR